MGPQHLRHQGVGLQGVQGVLQGIGQVLNAAGCPFIGVHLKDVLCDLLRRGELSLHAVQAGGQADGQRQIGVAGGVGVSQLHPGDSDQGRAVGGGPGGVAGGLIAGNQTLVGVDQGIGDGGHALHMGQQAGDEVIGVL